MKKLLFLSVVLLIGASSAPADLVNGGFDADGGSTPIWSVTGWSFSGASGTYGDVIGGGSDGGKCVWFRAGYRESPPVRLFQTFEASAGDILTADYKWFSEDVYPATDFGQGRIEDGAGNVVSVLFSHSLTEDPASGQTAWTSVGYQFTSSGTYTVIFEVGNGGPPIIGAATNDCLYIDNVRLLSGVTAVPAAEAGSDVTIYDSEQHLTTLPGSGTHTIGNTPLQYQWLEEDTVLLDWRPVAADHSANLDLATVPALSAGNHTLTLQVKDAVHTASDTMTLTIRDRAPEGSNIVNGGFEAEGRYTPIWYITAWLFDSTSGANGGTEDDFRLWGVDKNWRPTEGGCLVWIRSGYEGSDTIRLHQTFDASIGNVLSFDYFWVVGGGSDPTGIKIGAKLLDKGGNLVSTLFSRTLDSSTPWSEWTSVSYTFVASGTYTVSFEALSAASSVHLGIDNVALKAGAIPHSTAEAGPDVSISTSEQAQTTIHGSGTHPVPGTSLQYRWLEGDTVLQDWAPVNAAGAADLSLASPVPAFSIGDHILTLKVKDTVQTASDFMTLTVQTAPNRPPEVEVTPASQEVETGMEAVITATVADADGDTLSYEWRKGEIVIGSGTVNPPAGGSTVDLPDLRVSASDPNFPLGSNEVQLVVNDGANPAVVVTATVVVIVSEFYLHGTDPTLTLSSDAPTDTTATYQDSPSLRRTLFEEIGTWSYVVPSGMNLQLAGARDLRIWIGLKNSDDQGTYFDVRAELLCNGTVIAASETRDIQGVTRNPSKAKEVVVAFSTIPAAEFHPGDGLSIRILAKVTDTGGHSNAVGVRLYYDSADRPSRFERN